VHVTRQMEGETYMHRVDSMPSGCGMGICLMRQPCLRLLPCCVYRISALATSLLYCEEVHKAGGLIPCVCMLPSVEMRVETHQDLFEGAALRRSDINGDLVSLDLKQYFICLHTFAWLLQNASDGPLCMHGFQDSDVSILSRLSSSITC